MEWYEVDPIPSECRNCIEDDCYNCDAAGRRWELSREDELYARRKLAVHAIERSERQVAAIDRELMPFTPEQKSALEGKSKMTYDLFWECLQVCFDAGNMKMYMKIWHDYPEHVKAACSHRKAT